MDSYLLKCETTGSEALLVSISVTSNLFSLITPHEKTETAIEDILIVDLNNFRLKQALYCAASDLFLNKKRVEKDLEKKKSLSSEEYGDQSIYLMKKGASLYVPEKAILLDGHHRYSVINKYFFEDNNYVPIVFIDYKSLVVRDHYFSLDKIDMKEEVEDYLLHRCIPTNDNNYYDLQFFDGSKSYYFILKDSKDTKTRNRRFFLRDEVIKEYGFKPSPPLQKDKAGTQIYIAAKSPSKEELLSGELFPSKSTSITPKFNPELYKEYLNIERLN